MKKIISNVKRPVPSGKAAHPFVATDREERLRRHLRRPPAPNPLFNAESFRAAGGWSLSLQYMGPHAEAKRITYVERDRVWGDSPMAVVYLSGMGINTHLDSGVSEERVRGWHFIEKGVIHPKGRHVTIFPEPTCWLCVGKTSLSQRINVSQEKIKSEVLWLSPNENYLVPEGKTLAIAEGTCSQFQPEKSQTFQALSTVPGGVSVTAKTEVLGLLVWQ